MSPERLLEISEGYNPYYYGYMLDQGFDTVEKSFESTGGYWFMLWNNERWEENCKKIGVSRWFCSGYFDEHIQTICERLTKNGH